MIESPAVMVLRFIVLLIVMPVACQTFWHLMNKKRC
jgi:hypothetical protein